MRLIDDGLDQCGKKNTRTDFFSRLIMPLTAGSSSPCLKLDARLLRRGSSLSNERLHQIMGRKRQGGYFFVWFKGDHEPRHVHVFDKNEKLPGRVRFG